MSEFKQSRFFRGFNLPPTNKKKARQRWLWVAAPAALAVLAAAGITGYCDLRPRHLTHDHVTAPVPPTVEPTHGPALLPNTGTAGLLAQR
jgi:hypothetical protein